ncbi:MAG: type 1 glutamine amidotransferase domain-containing protein [Coleofasciculaceae cyanobacterium]
MTQKILTVVSSHQQFGDLTRKTGYWLEEVTHCHQVLSEAGFEIDFVSPQGGKPPMDEKSGDEKDKTNKNFLNNQVAVNKLENSLLPSQVNPHDYEAIYFAGGHGAMWDFPDNTDLARIAVTIYEAGKIVSAVCHGSAGLLNIKLSNGKYLIENKKVAGFSNREESLLRLAKHVPFMLEDKLIKRGAIYKKGLPFTPYTVVDERLVTGQNPFSTKRLAQELVTVLGGVGR